MTNLPSPLLGMEDVTFIGRGLSRPESVQVQPDGTIWASHRGRGVSIIQPDGSHVVMGPAPATANGHELIPNGIAPQRDGSALLANIGDGGGVWRLGANGSLEPHLMEVDGVFLAATNFVMTDALGRNWITVSTVSKPRFAAYSDKVADGLIILEDEKGARILADDICFANECRLSPDGQGLFVAETFSRRVTRFDVTNSGLRGRDTFAQFGRGDFPDGCRFDAQGHLWLTSIVGNRVWRIAPNGQAALVLADSEEAHIDWVEAALAEGRMGREHFYETGLSTLRNVASIDFSRDGRQAYFGSLGNDAIASISLSRILEQ